MAGSTHLLKHSPPDHLSKGRKRIWRIRINQDASCSADTKHPHMKSNTYFSWNVFHNCCFVFPLWKNVKTEKSEQQYFGVYFLFKNFIMPIPPSIIFDNFGYCSQNLFSVKLLFLFLWRMENNISYKIWDSSGVSRTTNTGPSFQQGKIKIKVLTGP